ncbi:hypothetical protein GCM10009642_56660 [Nocardiopsis metallicus]|uniref:Uncharacterized protein n=1 Tax=Nocardiopsis metallicus TaxID=179819 RepID=A0A840VZN5_9ACTN|nr:hypothetical protein [Nocardiopsis metallicus]
MQVTDTPTSSRANTTALNPTLTTACADGTHDLTRAAQTATLKRRETGNPNPNPSTQRCRFANSDPSGTETLFDIWV